MSPPNESTTSSSCSSSDSSLMPTKEETEKFCLQFLEYIGYGPFIPNGLVRVLTKYLCLEFLPTSVWRGKEHVEINSYLFQLFQGLPTLRFRVDVLMAMFEDYNLTLPSCKVQFHIFLFGNMLSVRKIVQCHPNTQLKYLEKLINNYELGISAILLLDFPSTCKTELDEEIPPNWKGIVNGVSQEDSHCKCCCSCEACSQCIYKKNN